jgi:hypothetical protein
MAPVVVVSANVSVHQYACNDVYWQFCLLQQQSVTEYYERSRQEVSNSQASSVQVVYTHLHVLFMPYSVLLRVFNQMLLLFLTLFQG